MATRTISTKLAVEGESEYKNAISNINSSLSTLNTKLELVKSEYQNNQNSMEALQKKSEVLAEKHDALAKKVDTCKSAYDNAKSSLTQYQNQTDSLKTALSNNETALSSLSKETQEAAQKWAEYDTKVKDAESKLAELQNTTGDTSKEEAELKKVIDDSKAAMSQLEEETGGAAKTAGELYEENNRLTSELEKAEAGEQAAAKACDQWEASTNKAQIQLNKCNAEIELNDKYMGEAAKSADGCATSIDQFGNTVTTADTNTGKLTKTMQNFQGFMLAGMLKKAFNQLKDAIMDCVDAAGEFESQMSTVEALSGATADEMEELTAVAKQMGATTAYTATEAGEALEYMALAGWSTNEMLDGLSGVMNLAAASGEDLSTVSDIVTDAITAFGYSASDTEHFVDVLASTSANSNTTVSQLGEAFQAVGSTAGTLGYSIDDVSQALGLMANNGIKGSTAGTSLATALTRMSGANSTATKELDKLNVSMYDAQGQTKPLNEFLLELRDALNENYDNAGDMQVALYNLAGQKGMKGLAAIVNSTDEDIQSLATSIDTCSGAAEEMAAIKLDNYEGQVTLLNSAWDALKTTIGEELTPALGDMAGGLTNIINKLDETLQNNPAIIDAFAALTAGVGAMSAALAVATVAKKAFDAVMDSVSGIGIAVTAIIGLTTAVVAFVAAMKNTSSPIDDMITSATTLTAVVDDCNTSIEETAGATETTADMAQGYVDRLGELADNAERTTDEEKEYQAICKKLLQIMPEMSAYISETADEYGRVTYEVTGTTQAMSNFIEEQKKAALIQVYSDSLEEEYTAWAEAAQENAELQGELTIKLNEAKAAENAYNDAIDQINGEMDEANKKADEYFQKNGILCDATDFLTDETKELYETYPQLYDEWQSAAAEADQLQQAVDASTEAMNAADEEIQRQTDLMDGVIDEMEALEDEQEEMAEDSYPAVTSAVENLAEELISLQDAYDDAYQSAYDSITGQFELWDEAAEVTAMDTDAMMHALETQQQYWNDLADNMENLAGRGIEGMDDLLASIDTTSTDGAALIAGLVSMNDDQLEEYIAQLGLTNAAEERAASVSAEIYTGYSANVSEAIQECVDTLSDMDASEETRQYAYNTLKGYISGLDDESDDVDAELKQVAEDSLAEFELALGITATSSSEMEAVGGNVAAGLANGISGAAADAVWAAKEMADQCINGTEDTLGVASPSTVFEAIGENTIQGYINGINNKDNAADSAMTSTAQDALEKFKETSTSTSLNSTGTDTLQGYINGISGQANNVTSKMKALANSAVTEFKDLSGTSALSSSGQNTIQGYINGIDSKSSSLYSKMTGVANNAMSKFKKALGISSPSTVMMEAGEFTGEGFIIGVENMAPSVNQSMAELAAGASEAFNTQLDYDEADMAADAFAASSAVPDEAEDSIIIQLPIYINGQYSREEIVDIALRGISRKQSGSYAAKGVTA